MLRNVNEHEDWLYFFLLANESISLINQATSGPHSERKQPAVQEGERSERMGKRTKHCGVDSEWDNPGGDAQLYRQYSSRSLSR